MMTMVFAIGPGALVAMEHPPLIAQATTITADEEALTKWIAGQQDVMLRDLREIVEINSGTLNVEGIDQVREILKTTLAELGFETRTVVGGKVTSLTCKGGDIQFADHLIATLNNGTGKRLLLNGHLDTVFPADSQFRHLRIIGDTLIGPGVSDMKGGLIAMVYALKALNAAGQLDDARLTVLLNSDEEMGSLGSRSLVEELAREHDVGLVFEGSSQNKLTRHRKGLGQARLVVTGRAAHAGNAHERGMSAIHELSHKIIEIEQLTDYDLKTTVNVGLVKGGEARNTISPCAEAYVDLRYPDNDLGHHLVREIKRVAAIEHTRNDRLGESPRTELWIKLHRPAKPVHPDSDALISLTMGISTELGQPLGTRYSGGGTDGSLMQAVGLPTIDSVGPDGKGDHSPREQSSISSLVIRTKVVAVLLSRLIAQ